MGDDSAGRMPGSDTATHQSVAKVNTVNTRLVTSNLVGSSKSHAPLPSGCCRDRVDNLGRT